ncbi:transcription factor GTE9-like isoform X1 [Nymphaea colorata]|nr:transcription factor GTE9-like isoform X1 [Nymphaea colorata]
MVAMGKSQKLSRRYSENFVSNYRLETTGESDGAGLHNNAAHSDSGGFCSSGRIDAELTASEDSCAPKRKLMSLNVDRSDALGVPLKVFSIANMSRSERRELARKLRVELEQVRGLQKKIASRCSNGIALSSSSGVRSWKPTVEKAAVGPSVSANGKGKSNKKASHVDLPELSSGRVRSQTSAGKHGGGLKRGPSGRFESANADAKKAKYKDLSVMTQCENLLKRLMTHQFGWVFNVPVDTVKLKIPDYFHIIKHPMDLGTIRSTLASGAYSSPHAFAADVRLTFSNAMTYNPPGNDVHFMADTLNKFFEVRWKAIEKKIAAINAQPCRSQNSIPAAASDLAVSEQSQQEKEKQPQPKKRKVSDANDKVKVDSAKRIMSDAEKHKLSRDLENLTGDMLEHVVDFLRGHSQTTNQNGEDEIEIDIDSLSDDVLFTLRKLLDDYLNKSQEPQQKAELIDVEPTEVEVLNESGLSNYSLQPCKGNEPADEDVDIGGNDPPVSSYPPVEIEKDMVARGGKCSSSSSSSSDSASSSSDSDSGSSSDSGTDGAKAISPVVATKETICSGPSLDQTGSEKFQTDDGSCPVSELAELEQNSQSKAVSSGADSQNEGENAPSGRQVSPDKLYRAALLRSRFADTILKAREKTLDQGDKGDPEKLRLEREELERQKREEKARLQAEAKAAEDARRQAEAAAAAEAKKKREREREAARLALQKMEKTVEIDENCQFLKDLEMLQSGPLPEHLPSSVDETSPDHYEDSMAAGFKLGGRNPLEQLGLYRKDDDEDEDDGLPANTAVASALPEGGDVEEGEID